MLPEKKTILHLEFTYHHLKLAFETIIQMREK